MFNSIYDPLIIHFLLLLLLQPFSFCFLLLLLWGVVVVVVLFSLFVLCLLVCLFSLFKFTDFTAMKVLFCFIIRVCFFFFLGGIFLCSFLFVFVVVVCLFCFVCFLVYNNTAQNVNASLQSLHLYLLNLRTLSLVKAYLSPLL